MKPALPIALAMCAAASLAIAPSVFADPDCRPYQKLIDTMPAGFASLKGMKADTVGDFTATLSLNEDKCEIWPDNGYHCLRIFGTEAEARAAVATRLDEAKPCFPGWTLKTIADMPSPAPGVRDFLFDAAFARVRDKEMAIFMLTVERQLRERGRPTQHFYYIVTQSLKLGPRPGAQ